MRIFKSVLVVGFLLVMSFSASVVLMSTTPMVALGQKVADVGATTLGHDTVSFVTSWREAAWTETMDTAYTQDEHAHLSDVRTVFTYVRYLLLFCISGLIVCSIKTKARRALRRWMVAARPLLAWTQALCILLSVCAVTLFQKTFTWVHSLLFQPGTWEFPPGSRLTNLFPDSFWLYWGISILVGTIVLLALIQLFGPRRQNTVQ